MAAEAPVHPRGELGGRKWQRLVEYVLRRDGYRCRFERSGRRCANEAFLVTHLDPGGRRRDPDNLVASCGRHYGDEFRDRFRSPAVGLGAKSQERRNWRYKKKALSRRADQKMRPGRSRPPDEA